MNEHIKELAEQANEIEYETFDEYNHKTVKHYKFNKEKFAQSIVRTCMDIALANDDPFTTIDIADYFGVEQ